MSGDLPLRFCSRNFALRRPSWGLPASGGVRALCYLIMVLVVWLILWLMEVWLALWVAGLKVLEEFGRECGLPRKRMVLWFVGVMFHMFFMVLGGRSFVLVKSFGFWGS